MTGMEICANCASVISHDAEAHLWNEHVVCRDCREKLEKEPVGLEKPAAPAREHKHSPLLSSSHFRTEDYSSPLPAKPRQKLMEMDGRFDFLPMQQVELTLQRGEDEFATMTVELPNRLSPQAIAHAAETESHKKVVKVTILKRSWKKSEKRAIHESQMTSQAIWEMCRETDGVKAE